MSKHMPILMGILTLLTMLLCIYIIGARAQDMEILFDGVAPGQRDYVIQYRAPGESLITEDHFQLFPPAQWYDPHRPLYNNHPYSTFKDWDGHPTEQWSRYGNTRYIWDWDYHTWKSLQ